MIAARPTAFSPTATQSLPETQDRLLRPRTPGGTARRTQLTPPFRVARIAAPRRSLPTATQSLLDEHETSAKEGAPAGYAVSTKNWSTCLPEVVTFLAAAVATAGDAAAATGTATTDATARLTPTTTRRVTDETRRVVRHAGAEPTDPPHRHHRAATQGCAISKAADGRSSTIGYGTHTRTNRR